MKVYAWTTYNVEDKMIQDGYEIKGALFVRMLCS